MVLVKNMTVFFFSAGELTETNSTCQIAETGLNHW